MPAKKGKASAKKKKAYCYYAGKETKAKKTAKAKKKKKPAKKRKARKRSKK